MTFGTWFSYIVTIITAGIAALAFYRDPRSFVHRIFAVGMVVFALDAGLHGLAYQSSSLATFLFWYQLQLVTASFLPAFWLLFSLSFARTNYLELITKWKWVLISSFVLPISMVILFNNAFFVGQPVFTNAATLFIHIGWSGYVW
ncbi:MAG TPA: histidine kinase N-terminal 7TM domain-containing protein, partial [Syntrophales bacterium]|nr:histidine kinase N-terminal 7TM domain-containing protein [Syntrophales bacterium]